MSVFNAALLRPRNVIAILAITSVTHFLAKPLYTKVDRKDTN